MKGTKLFGEILNSLPLNCTESIDDEISLAKNIATIIIEKKYRPATTAGLGLN